MGQRLLDQGGGADRLRVFGPGPYAQRARVADTTRSAPSALPRTGRRHLDTTSETVKQKRMAAAAEQYKAVVKEHGKAQQDFSKEYRKAKTDVPSL